MKKLCSAFSLLFLGTTFAQNCLVGEYPLNGNINDVVTSGSGVNNGAVAGADRYGNAGGALYFNGSTSNAYLVNDYDYATRTIAFWFKANSTSATLAGMFETDNSGLVNAQTELGVAYYASANQISFAIGGVNNKVWYPFNLGQWYHIAAVRDVSQIRYYVNCNLVGTATDMTDAHSSQGNSMSVIGSLSYGSYYFNGALDEIRIYNCVLPQTSIDSICTIDVGVNEAVAKNNGFNSMKINLELTDEQLINKVFELNDAGEKTTLSIYNSFGQVVFSGVYGNGVSLTIPQMKSGIYYYNLQSNTLNKSGTISLSK